MSNRSCREAAKRVDAIAACGVQWTPARVSRALLTAATQSLGVDRLSTATGQEQVLADDRSKAIHLVMLARLLKRIFEIDMQHCPNCAGGYHRIQSHSRRS